MRTALLALALLALTAPWAAAQSCRLALVLALDVSGSVNDVEYAQQVNGLAYALDDPEVRRLILSGGGAHVALAAFEWSSQNHQYPILPWTTLDSPAAIDRAVSRIASHGRIRAGLRTAMGTSLAHAAGLLAQKPECWQMTIDVSGDGKNNIGPEPRTIYAGRGFARVIVNALVVIDPTGDEVGTAIGIGPNRDTLLRYFETEVIHGPGAFAMVAEGYADYARAMRLKLLRELAVPVFGARALPPGTPPG